MGLMIRYVASLTIIIYSSINKNIYLWLLSEDEGEADAAVGHGRREVVVVGRNIDHVPSNK